MADRDKDKPQPALPRYSRRQALILSLGTAVALMLDPKISTPKALASTNKPQKPLPEFKFGSNEFNIVLGDPVGTRYNAKTYDQESVYDGEFNWEYSHFLAKKAANLEKRPWAKSLVDVLGDDLKMLEKVYHPFEGRLNISMALIQEQHKERPKTSLIAYGQKNIGSMQSIDLEDVLPFYSEKKAVASSLLKAQIALEEIIRKKNEYSDTNLNYLYENLHYFLLSGVDYMTQASGSEAKALCRGQVFIDIDPARDVTPQGRLEFYKDKGIVIADFLDTLQAYNNICSEFILTSSRYGPLIGWSATGNALGVFRSDKLPGSHLYFAEHRINTDEVPELGKHTIKYVTSHEAGGHGTDFNINMAARGIVLPEGEIEGLTYWQEVMDDQNWAGNDLTVEGLFKNFPATLDVGKFLDEQGHVDSDTFMGITTRYPKNRILLPEVVIVLSSKGMRYQAISLADYLLGLPVDGDKVLGEVQKPQDLSKTYQSLDEFEPDFMPLLQSDTALGNKRATIMLAALQNFKKDISNYQFFWEMKLPDGSRFAPTIDKSASTWFNYLRFIASDAVLYHSFFNGSINGVDLRNLFNAQQRIKGEKVINSMRWIYRAEGYAEGVALSHLLGSRVHDDNPYRNSLRLFAHLVS